MSRPTKASASACEAVSFYEDTDSADIRTSRPIGAAAAFDRRVAGASCRYATSATRLIDDQTGSRWDPLSGRATAGPLRGPRLGPLRHDEQFWFALAAFYPHATIARCSSQHARRPTAPGWRR